MIKDDKRVKRTVNFMINTTDKILLILSKQANELH